MLDKTRQTAQTNYRPVSQSSNSLKWSLSGAECPCLLEAPSPAPTSQPLVLQPLLSTAHTDPNTQPPRGTHPWPTLQPASSPKPSESSCRRVDRVSPRFPARALYNQHHFCRQRGCTPCTSLSSPSHTDTSPKNSPATASWGARWAAGYLWEAKLRVSRKVQKVPGIF